MDKKNSILAFLGVVKWPFSRGRGTKKKYCHALELGDRSNLTAGDFGTSGSSETLCTSFERSNQCVIGATKLKAWQYFFFVPRPLETGHFTPKKG